MKIFRYVSLLCLFLPCVSVAQQNCDFYISNKGNDSFPGTSELFAKQTITGIAPILKIFSESKGSVKVGLKSGDTFNENLVTSYPIELNTYTGNSDDNDFAILNGTKEFSTGWIPEPGTGNTFKQAIPYSGFTGYGINDIGSYSFIYVFEIDKELEKTAPFTARKLLKFVPESTAVETTPGSFSTAINTNENPMPVFIHTSDGTSPNANIKYRYEVTVRDWAVNSTYEQGNKFENLWVRGFGAGNGMLPGGANSFYNKIIFGPGAAIHHLVVRSGTINHSLFLPGPKNTNENALVFYDTEGMGRHCIIENSMFLDIRSPVYAHTSLGTNFGAVEMDNVLGFADTTDTDGFMFTSNTDTVILNNVYTDGYTSGYNYGKAKYAAISNCYFKNVNFGIAYSADNPVNSLVNNVFIKTKGTSYTTGIYMQDNTFLKLNNSIIHLSNNYTSYWPNAGSFVYGAGGPVNKIAASGNIFICDINPSATLIAATTNTNNGVATSTDSWNNNVYVLLKGNKIAWATTNASTNKGSLIIQNFDEWKKQSGQDKNSLFFDLRNDPRGLRAIFADPDNGNYDLANTMEGNQIAAMHAGMTSPITCFLQKPSYEAAAGLIRSNKVLSINTCRNPCLQNTIRVNATFYINAINIRQVKLQWNISEQQNIDHYEIEKSTGNYDFKRLVSIPVSSDSLYSVIDDLQPGVVYSYRLLVVPLAGGKCYSDIRTIKINDSKAFTIYPNPSTGKIMVSLNGYIGHTNFIVSNSTGQPVLVKDVFNVYDAHELDLTNQPRGIYFLKVETSNGISVQKFALH